MRRTLAACVAMLLAVFAFTVAASTAAAGMIHSNGHGGGPWSDPDTWHGGKVPGEADDAVIAMRDAVTFDLDHRNKVTCNNLYLDPEGVLGFKTGPGDFVITVAGTIESYGVIKVDATRSAGLREIHMRAEKQDAVLQLLQGGAMLIYGRESAATDERNVWIRAVTTETRLPAKLIYIRANDEAMVDLHHIGLDNVAVDLEAIDNTNAVTTERLNFIGGLWINQSRLQLRNCDTPGIRSNTFIATDPVAAPAIRLVGCKLSEIVGNRITGAYDAGIETESDTDSSATSNLIVGCNRGIVWRGTNMMIRHSVIRDCATGLTSSDSTGVVENVTVHGAKFAFSLASSIQLTNCNVVDMPEGGAAMSLDNCTVTLLNCNIADDVIQLGKRLPAGNWVETMSYLMVRVSGNVPDNAVVHVETAKVSGGVPGGGKADLNVRNTPAPIDRRGFTPLPQSSKPLAVKSWAIGRDGKRVNAPFYDLMVKAPDEPGKPFKTLKSLEQIEPSEAWFRTNPDALDPTLEVTLP